MININEQSNLTPWSCGHQVGHVVSSGYSGFLPHEDLMNTNIGANKQD